jgi:hypothetical protein
MDATATENPPSPPENDPREPRDSSDSSSIAFDENVENRWTLRSETTLNELFLPLDRSEPLGESRQDEGAAATYQEDPYDGLIAVEGQNVADLSGSSNPISTVELDEEERQLQASFQTLLQRPTFFTPSQPRPWLSQDSYFYTRHDEPTFADYFQQAITGLASHQSLEDSLAAVASRRGSTFDEGLIPSEHQQISIFQSAHDPAPPDAQPLIDSNSLSQNLLSILQRPTFLASPSARWTAPPQWLQFQLLRSYDEGLMVSETQEHSALTQSYAGPTNSVYVEEVQSQVQINLQGLLQSHQNDSIPAAATRWQIPESWAQSSMGDFFPIRPPIALEYDKYLEGLMLVDRRANDPLSTPAVTCNFGLMQQVGFGERKLEFFTENFNAVDAGFFAHRVQSQAANTMDLMFL